MVTDRDKMIENNTKKVLKLQQEVIKLRDNAIIVELSFFSGKAVAEKYNLSEGRISQIKKSKKKKSE